MLDALGDAVKDTIQELRDLAHGIYPPLLMDAGLAEALRAAANRSPLAVSVDADGHRPLPDRASRRRCTSAASRRCRTPPSTRPTRSVAIALREADGVLRFSVQRRRSRLRRGRRATAGHGYVNMSDRLGAIGGTVEWRSAPGEGAEISGTIPLP